MDREKFRSENLSNLIFIVKDNWIRSHLLFVKLDRIRFGCCPFMWEYETILDNYFLPICIWKCWRNIREISPPPLPSVSCLPRRGDPTCSLTLPTDLTDNYFLFIGGYLHASTCLFVGFFLLVCGIWVLWWCGFFKRSTHDYEILFSFILELWITKITPRILFA